METGDIQANPTGQGSISIVGARDVKIIQPPRAKIATGKTDDNDSAYATNDPELTDYDRKMLLLNKLKELEPLVKEFKDILKNTPVNAIRAEPPTKQDDS